MRLDKIFNLLKELAVNVIAAGVLCPVFIRRTIYGLFGEEIEPSTRILPRAYLGLGHGRLKIGGGLLLIIIVGLI